ILMYGWPFAFERANIVTLAVAKLRKGEKVHAYDDVYANPLLNSSCAVAIWNMIDKNEFGVFNIAGSDRVNIYQLLTRTAEIFGLDENLISPVQQGYFNELARRPRDTSFRTDKMETVLGLKPLTLEEGLIIMRETC
ncbi:MAG: sugar nucleotide-binding protein, partial [Syntrophorhabdaceae bacterium]|nr:sugar nucleotide-binding protein [Syntrophorhabdaceae bacterium]